MQRIPVRTFIFLAAVLLAASVYAQPATWQIDPAHSSAQFTVRHLMVSNVRGEFGKVSGTVLYDAQNLSKISVEASIDTTSINTREPKRDTHLKSGEFLDVATYPTITFKSKRVEQSANNNLRVIGDLTIRGVTKEVVLDVPAPTPAIKDPWGNTRMGASATTKINRKDFGVKWNGLLESGGAVVGDDVAITIDVELVKQAPTPAGAGEAPTKTN